MHSGLISSALCALSLLLSAAGCVSSEKKPSKPGGEGTASSAHEAVKAPHSAPASKPVKAKRATSTPSWHAKWNALSADKRKSIIDTCDAQCASKRVKPKMSGDEKVKAARAWLTCKETCQQAAL